MLIRLPIYKHIEPDDLILLEQTLTGLGQTIYPLNDHELQTAVLGTVQTHLDDAKYILQ